MKLHFFTEDTAPYSFETDIEIMDDADFHSQCLEETINEILNSEEVLDIIIDSDLSDIVVEIEPLFDMGTNGVFDWTEETDKYYDFVNEMLRVLICDVEDESGILLSHFTCGLSDCFHFSDSKFSLNLSGFYSGNGEPIGAQLALDMVEAFMDTNEWNIGLFDSEGKLISDIAEWSKCHVLDIKTIKPVIWFGCKKEISDCWSITPQTTDSFVEDFWGDYFEGALPYICKANEGLGIYYSVWEYGIEHDSSTFDEIKASCPINIDLSNEDRANALYNLVTSLYNKNKAANFPTVEQDLYLKNVINCNIIVSIKRINYYYSKPYRFSTDRINSLNEATIEDILCEDEAYKNSFLYLKDNIIDRCETMSCEDVWKQVRAAVMDVQQELNEGLMCQITKDDKVIGIIPLTITLSHFNLQINDIRNIVFMKSVIAFFKRGKWHIGYKDASSLPKICNAMAQEIEQTGTYPIIWFNDSENINGKLGIWSAQTQYMLSLYWSTASDFCSHVFNNIEIHNECRDTSLYKELDIEFQRVKSECPITIRTGNAPVDFEELEEVVKRSANIEL